MITFKISTYVLIENFCPCFLSYFNVKSSIFHMGKFVKTLPLNTPMTLLAIIESWNINNVHVQPKLKKGKGVNFTYMEGLTLFKNKRGKGYDVGGRGRG